MAVIYRGGATPSGLIMKYKKGTFVGKKRNLNGFTFKYRIFIYEKCLNKCFYCAKSLEEMLSDESHTIDHLIPKSKGGKNEEENLVLSCRSCNSKKGTKTLEQLKKMEKIKKSKSYLKFLQRKEYYNKLFKSLK